MNNDQNSKKLNYQLQEMAFQKYPFEINNKTFFCLQTYFDDQLLNGIDLELKEAKGITSEPQKISYLAQNQQLILAIGSNIVSYNAQKRSYTLLVEVTGFVQILRTYTCKLNNRTYIFWLQTDQQGLNMRINKHSLKYINQKGSYQINQGQKKIPSIWNIFDPINMQLKKASSSDSPKLINKNSAKSVNTKFQINDQLGPKKVKFNEDDKKQDKPKSKKKVRIEAPSDQESQEGFQKNKKKMRICIFDYQKKQVIHRQRVQIQDTESISDIILYYTAQKMIGYVINDQNQERGKVYYKKIKIDDSSCTSKAISRRFLNKKKNTGVQKKPSKFNVLDSIFQIPQLKYNGQTDQYLFKDINTVYSLQLYQVQHELFIGKGSSKYISKKDINNAQHKGPAINSKNSIKIESDEQSLDEDNLSRQIQKLTNKMISSTFQDNTHQKQNYRLKINQQIQLFTDETIIDMSIGQVYLVVLTNEFIRFYSIFNLNTLLFKSEIHDLKNNPPPSSVQLNKSYLLLTHENSTLVSSYTIMERKLKHNSTCEVQIQHCQSIVKLYMNSYNCEVAILARQFQIQGRMTNIIKSRKIIQNTVSGFKKTYIDLCLAYINFSSTKCQTKPLFLKNQRFRNILTCKWHSQYLVQTENQIVAKQWRQSFQNLKCSCLHPTGQYLIIGFNDCFKIYSVTQEGLQNTYMSDGVKDCQAIAYSEFGEHFAVGSSNSIGIYNSYNSVKKQVITLPMGSLVQTLEYRSNHLLCVLRSKRIIIYHVLLDYKEIFTFNPKNYLNENKHQFQRKPGESVQNLLTLTIKGLVSIDINSLYYDLQLNVIVFSSGKKIFFVNTLNNQSLGSYEIQGISCMEYNKHLATLFLGTFTGELIAFPWPNKPSNILSELPRFKFHSEKILKIKLTSDFKYLITLGNDMSIYKCHINYILNLKRLKGNQIAEYKGNKNAVLYCNFLFNKGICQFSHSQNTQKLQNKKQLQEEVVNTVFMLPQQRLKQKQQLFQQISVTKQQLNSQNVREYEPLQQQSISLRNKIIKIKEQFIRTKRMNEASLQKQKQDFIGQTSKYLKLYSQLNYESRMTKLELQQQTQKQKYFNLKQYNQLLKQQQEKQKEFEIKLKSINQNNQKTKKDFLQIDLIQKQKQNFLRNHLSAYLKEIQLITTKNGQLSCKNSSIQKQILVVRHRIEELKFVILNAKSSTQKLKGKQLKQTQQKRVFQRLLLQNAKIDVSQMQKKYIKATKQLIQKNKQIDINLSQYEKQKQILIQLQKTVENTQNQIDNVVQALEQQKQFMKYLKQKQQANQTRFKQLSQVRNTKKVTKNKLKLYLKKFVQSIQKVQKDFQTYNNSNTNKKQTSTETVELMQNLKSLQHFGKKNYQKERLIQVRQSVRKSHKTKQKKKRQFTEFDEGINQNTSQTAIGQLMDGLKKTTSNAVQNKKAKRLKCLTQNSQSLNKETNKSEENQQKSTYKLNHNKFRDQFKIHRKDDFFNNTKSNFRDSEQPSANANTLRKVGSIFYQLKTQNSHNTERLFNKSKQSKPTNQMTSRVDKVQESFKSKTFRNSCSYEREKMISRQKQNVFKKLTTQEKLVGKIGTDKKLFMTSKKKLHIQNQDLISTYNSLTYDNKYFKNILKTYEQNLDDEDKNFILKNPIASRQLSKDFLAFATQSTQLKDKSNIQNYSSKIDTEEKILTPFDKYLKNKQAKICEMMNSKKGDEMGQTTREGFKISLNRKLNTKTADNKRINTVPCVQLIL